MSSSFASSNVCLLLSLTIVVSDKSLAPSPSPPSQIPCPGDVFDAVPAAVWTVDSARGEDEVIRLTIAHPFLSSVGANEAYAGLTYQVGISAIGNGTIDGFIIKSSETKEGHPVGRFQAPPQPSPSDITICHGFSHVAHSHQPFARNSTRIVFWTAQDIGHVDAVNITVYVLRDGNWYQKSILVHHRHDGCHRYVSSDRGTIESSDFHHEFPNCSEHVVIINVPKDYQVYLHFQSVNLLYSKMPECSKEYIEVSLADQNRVWSREKLCGYLEGHQKLKRLNFVAQQEALVIRVKIEEGSAFKATHYVLDKRKGCNSTVTTPSGIVTSPGFPAGYSPGLDCFTLIRVPPKHTLALRLLHLTLLLPASSCDDYLLVTSSSPSDDRRFCGHSELHPTLFTSGSVTLHFHSDWSSGSGSGGFLLDYTLVGPRCDDDDLGMNSSDGSTSTSELISRWEVRCVPVVTSAPGGFTLRLRVSGLPPPHPTHTPLKPRLTADGEAKATALNSWRCYDGYLEVVMDDGASWILCDLETSVDVAVGIPAASVSSLRLVRHTSESRPAIAVGYAPRPTERCDAGWFPFSPSSFSPHFCYLLVEEPLSWMRASNYCLNLGAQLVSVADQRTQLMLDNLMKASSSSNEDVAFWTGGNDRLSENSYKWADGRSVSYTNWFKGWHHFNKYNRQPSDDGLSDQDCIEMRRSFLYPTKGVGRTEGYFWNDRDCSVSNPFLCEKREVGASVDASISDCNRTVMLTLQRSSEVITSPGYPAPYANNVDCTVTIQAPSGYKIVLTFSTFVLEESHPCQYDYLEMTASLEEPTRFCGDWSGRLKFLRQKSNSNRFFMKFVSDYSHAYAGFVADVHLEEEKQLCEGNQHSYNGHCYWIVTSPAVTWYAANQQCAIMHSHLSSVESWAEEAYLTNRIKESDYPIQNPFWLGAFRASPTSAWAWTDSSSFSYTESKMDASSTNSEYPLEACLSWQWQETNENPGIQWVDKECNAYGSYICKKKAEVIEENLNDTVKDSLGNISSPSFPSTYANNLHYTVKILGPPKTRILIKFLYLDLEWQEECLYDYVGLQSSESRKMLRFCGSDGKRDDKWEYVSDANVAHLTFRSDFSESGGGFLARYKVVDVSGCPSRSLMNVEGGVLSSVNYPDFYLNSMDCETTVEVPSERWTWLQFESFSVGFGHGGDLAGDICTDDFVALSMRDSPAASMDSALPLDDFSGIKLCGNLTHDLHNMGFMSEERTFRLLFHSDTQGRFEGFLAQFVALLSPTIESIAILYPNTFGPIHRLNYPLSTVPANANVTRQLVVPLGYIVQIRVEGMMTEDDVDSFKNTTTSWGCDDWSFELSDPYLTAPPTVLCPLEAANSSGASDVRWMRSYFNVLTIRELTGSRLLAYNDDDVFKITYAVIKDAPFLNKTALMETRAIPFCHPYACLHDGQCLHVDGQNACRCYGHYTGAFCHLTVCDSNPCIFGTCNLTTEGHSCICYRGYGGVRCENKVNPCGQNPCGTRGACMIQNDGFICRCHIWWQGPMCETRAAKIPYKPLSKRMLEEPFWLGLITVFVVLAVLGLVWCIKRKFADKLEKFIAEEIEKSKQNQSCKSSKRHSIRDQGSPVSLSPQTCPRSLFSRIGLRKHSMLSLDSSGSSPNYHENRSFSFDDIIKKSDSQKRLDKRSQSPIQQLDKKELLHSLVAPPLGAVKGRRMSLDEFIQMSEKKILERKNSRENASSDSDGISEETSFSNAAAANRQAFKKRVNFVRTLEKIDSVSFENERDEDPAEGGTPNGLNQDDFCVGRNSIDDHLSETGSSCSSKISSGLYEIPESLFSDCSATDSDMKRNNNEPRRTLRRSDCSSEEADSSWASSDLLKTAAKSEVRAEIHKAPHDRDSEATNESCGSDKRCYNCCSSHRTGGSSDRPGTPRRDRSGAEDEAWVKRCSSLDTPLPDDLFSKPRFDDDPRWYHASTMAKLDPFDLSPEKTRDRLCVKNAHQTTYRELLPKLHPLGRPGSPIPSPHTKMEVYSFNAPDQLGLEKESRGAPVIQILPSPPAGAASEPNQYLTPRQEKAFPEFPLSICQEKAFPEFPLSICQEKAAFPTFPAPIITITASNVSSCESDTDSPTKTTARMHYLSPFDVIRQGSAERSTSLSNLSSSGYSSMASPGPSRCNSNSPLFGTDVDGEISTACSSYRLSPTNLGRRQQQHRPLGLNLPFPSSSPKHCPGALRATPKNGTLAEVGLKRTRPPLLRAVSVMRKRSDSETTDEQAEPGAPHEDSNDDEGIGMDHIDFKIHHGEVTSAKDLELYMGAPSETEAVKADRPQDGGQEFVCPAIVVQTLLQNEVDGKDRCWKFVRRRSFQRKLSPVSSRSESPMSDRGCPEKCPGNEANIQDSSFGDLEDVFAGPASPVVELKPPPSGQQRKAMRRKEKSQLHKTKANRVKALVDVPKEGSSMATGAKKSPKRRIRLQNSMDADSSSSDSSSCSSARLKELRSSNLMARMECNKRNVSRCDSLPLPARKPSFGMAPNRPDVTRVGASSIEEWSPLSNSEMLGAREQDDEVFEEPGCHALEEIGYSAVNRWKVDQCQPDVDSETSEFSEEDSGSEVSFYLRNSGKRSEKGESKRLLSPARLSPDMAIICYSGGGFGRKCSEEDD